MYLDYSLTLRDRLAAGAIVAQLKPQIMNHKKSLQTQNEEEKYYKNIFNVFNVAKNNVKL